MSGCTLPAVSSVYRRRRADVTANRGARIHVLSGENNRLEDKMPGLAGRISTLTKAKISHMLDHAEDPGRDA